TAASAAGRSFGTTIFCGTLNKSSGNSLVPGVAVESVVRRWRFAPSASIVRAVSALLNSAGLFSSSTIVACLSMRFMPSVIESLTVAVDLLSRAVDIGDRLDGRAVEHEKALGRDRRRGGPPLLPRLRPRRSRRARHGREVRRRAAASSHPRGSALAPGADGRYLLRWADGAR